ncbi:type I phosphomannose isomerase catalytic subunit [Robertkochia flava]|uniref:type I phosphomannose isomerase catalytic subunit n=1 Tax=Robertkochia flava TaxID=3447986 RepID=UPI001CCB6015|nr:type I phosphomannose isomerase catalytic subunit [Robertkochia marina]
MKLYPLKFDPVFCYRIWGGEKLKTKLNKNYTENNIGESWEISGIQGMETHVSNGALKGRTLSELITDYQADFVGSMVYTAFGDEFPLLIKFIDAQAPLSVQVHPNDILAKQRHNSPGKNEMWYIMQADETAELIVGFNKLIEKNECSRHIARGTVLEVLNTERVSKGDTYFIPSGRIHAIGAGVLLAEIQQPSDITYRIYDYDRVDPVSKTKRELHTDLALDALDYHLPKAYKTTYTTNANTSCKLVHTAHFKSDIVVLEGLINKDFRHLDSFVIYICVEGSLELYWNNETFALNTGEIILIPACIKKIRLKSESARILEVYI